MKDTNKCEHPINAWFNQCDKVDKNGKYSMGIGKAVADVKVYSLADPSKTVFEYAMCEDCLECEMLEGMDAENNRVELTKQHKGDPVIYQIVEIKYRDGRESEFPLATIIIKS